MSAGARTTRVLRLRRHARLRKRLAGTPERPRLAVHRSSRHISAQVIDDLHGTTVAAASSVEPELRERLGAGRGGNVAAARAVGELVARRAKAAGVAQVVFDRGGYAYHGRVAAVVEAAREEGLEF